MKNPVYNFTNTTTNLTIFNKSNYNRWLLSTIIIIIIIIIINIINFFKNIKLQTPICAHNRPFSIPHWIRPFPIWTLSCIILYIYIYAICKLTPNEYMHGVLICKLHIPVYAIYKFNPHKYIIHVILLILDPIFISIGPIRHYNPCEENKIIIFPVTFFY